MTEDGFFCPSKKTNYAVRLNIWIVNRNNITNIFYREKDMGMNKLMECFYFEESMSLMSYVIHFLQITLFHTCYIFV